MNVFLSIKLTKIKTKKLFSYMASRVNYINITIFLESSVTKTIKALKMYITFDLQFYV